MNNKTSIDDAIDAKKRQRAEEMTKQYLSDIGLEVDNEQFELFVKEALNIISRMEDSTSNE